MEEQNVVHPLDGIFSQMKRNGALTCTTIWVNPVLSHVLEQNENIISRVRGYANMEVRKYSVIYGMAHYFMIIQCKQ
jgi:hypothetical protein